MNDFSVNCLCYSLESPVSTEFFVAMPFSIGFFMLFDRSFAVTQCSSYFEDNQEYYRVFF